MDDDELAGTRPPDRVTAAAWAQRRRALQHSVTVSMLRSLLVGTVLIAVYAVLPVGGVSGFQIIIRLATAGLVIIGTVLWGIHAVNKAALPLPRAMEALFVTIFVAMATFATAYLNLSAHDSDSFSEPLGKISSLYFTVTTLATVGYGDITPKSDPARISVMIQMVINVAVVGTAVKVIIEKARTRRGESRAIAWSSEEAFAASGDEVIEPLDEN